MSVSDVEMKDEIFVDEFESDEIVLIIEPTVIKDESVSSLSSDLERNVERITLRQRRKRGVSVRGETDRSESTKFVVERIIGAIFASHSSGDERCARGWIVAHVRSAFVPFQRDVARSSGESIGALANEPVLARNAPPAVLARIGVTQIDLHIASVARVAAREAYRAMARVREEGIDGTKHEISTRHEPAGLVETKLRVATFVVEARFLDANVIVER